MNMILLVLQTAMLLTALAIDSFACSFGYGINKIVIPFKSMMTINLICTVLLAIGLFFGVMVGQYIPENITTWFSFTLLFLLGIFKIFDSGIKKLVRKHNGVNKEIKFSIFNLGFVLYVYADPEEADVDKSKELSMKEAVPLALALGIDGLSVGFGIGLAVTHVFLLLGLSLISDMIAITLGCYLGNKMAQRTSRDMSWISGAILMIIAVFQIF